MPEKIINIKTDSVTLEGALEVPDGAEGIVIFAHGSGSSRFSPRNNYVAQVLRNNGLGTLLIDLLSEAEDVYYETRFDIDLLTHRLVSATLWVEKNSDTRNLAVGYFGASTGAAAAFKAAARLDDSIKAVVSRGGRPDLAKPDLDKVVSPTLLIVGEFDDVVIELNKEAYQELKCEKKIIVVSDATHLFEEPGALEKVAELAASWFKQKLM